MKHPTDKPKMYVIRKYVMARSVVEAARKEKDAEIHEVFIDDKWKDANLADAIGFTTSTDEE